MSRGTFKDLRDLREHLANLRAVTVAELRQIPRGRLNDIEEGAPPSILEIERLAAVYGIDADALWDEPIHLGDADAIGVLTSQDEFRQVSDMTRAKMLRAASAARDLVTLHQLVGDGIEPVPKLPAFNPILTPYQQGAELAHSLRRSLGLGVAPIPSLRDLVAQKLPSIAVLYSDLDRHGRARVRRRDARSRSGPQPPGQE